MMVEGWDDVLWFGAAIRQPRAAPAAAGLEDYGFDLVVPSWRSDVGRISRYGVHLIHSPKQESIFPKSEASEVPRAHKSGSTTELRMKVACDLCCLA